MFKWLIENSRWVLNNKGFWQQLLMAIAKQQALKAGKQTAEGRGEDIGAIDLVGAVKSAMMADAKAGDAKDTQALKEGIKPPPGIKGDIVTTGPGGRPIIGRGEATPSIKPARLATPYESRINLPPPQTAPGLPPPTTGPPGRYGVPEAFGRAFVGMPMERERMGPAAYTGAFIPDVLRSKLGLTTTYGRQYKDVLQEYYRSGVPVVTAEGEPVMDPTTGLPKMAPYRAFKQPKPTKPKKKTGAEMVKEMGKEKGVKELHPTAQWDYEEQAWVVIGPDGEIMLVDTTGIK